jgi:hypothetical protein
LDPAHGLLESVLISEWSAVPNEPTREPILPAVEDPMNRRTFLSNCSLGWQQHTWETLLQKKVSVDLKESVLRGGKRCVFEIHVSEQAI